MPKYSIIIPAHNDEYRIIKALQSIRDQSFTDYEIIVVCDACTDSTASVARMFTQNVIDVEYNRDGLSRNAGIELATGEWILFMDSDDWWLHEFVLQRIDDAIKLLDPDILAFGFVWRTIGVAGPVREEGMLWPNVWSKAWKRSIIGDTRFSDEWSVSDLGFTNAVLAKKPKVSALNEALYYYNYMREGSITERDSHK